MAGDTGIAANASDAAILLKLFTSGLLNSTASDNSEIGTLQ
jgi:hypothetical protein